MFGYVKRFFKKRREKQECLERSAERHFYNINEIENVLEWCDGEARLVAKWLMEKDFRYWDNIPPHWIERTGPLLPYNIAEFREYLRNARTQKDDGWNTK